MNLIPLAAAIGLAPLAACPAQAFNPQPDPPARFAMVGLVSDQTARLNVVARSSSRRDVPPGPCRLTLSFSDSQGNPLMNITTLVLNPGKADYVDLPGARVTSSRIQFLPAVQVQPNAPGVAVCPGVSASVELIDPSGHTTVYIDDPNLYLPQ